MCVCLTAARGSPARRWVAFPRSVGVCVRVRACLSVWLCLRLNLPLTCLSERVRLGGGGASPPPAASSPTPSRKALTQTLQPWLRQERNDLVCPCSSDHPTAVPAGGTRGQAASRWALGPQSGAA